MKTSRRKFLKQAGAVGLTTTMVGQMACTNSDSKPEYSPETDPTFLNALVLMGKE